MPRARQRSTLSGAPAQPIAATAGQVYGAGVDQMAMQRNMPAPQTQGQRPAGTAPPDSPADVAVPVDRAAALAAAQSLRGQTGLLTSPTTRPNEPITAGLSRGPGPGPEAMVGRQGSPAGEMLRHLTQLTGNPYFAELADKAKA
jgi:hypothetical protein